MSCGTTIHLFGRIAAHPPSLSSRRTFSGFLSSSSLSPHLEHRNLRPCHNRQLWFTPTARASYQSLDEEEGSRISSPALLLIQFGLRCATGKSTTTTIYSICGAAALCLPGSIVIASVARLATVHGGDDGCKMLHHNTNSNMCARLPASIPQSASLDAVARGAPLVALSPDGGG